MRISTFFLTAIIVAIISSCGNDNKSPENTGTNQVPPPVQNAGPETEAERATEAVKQDSTNQEIHVGKDEKGAKAKSTDSIKK